jgi:PST family polysaccharide transporter
LPLLARLRSEPARYRAAFTRAYTPAMLLLLPVGLVLSLLPEAVVATVFGPGWEAAIPVLGWLGLAVATQLVGTATGTLLLSQQRGGDFAIQGVVGAALSVASFVVGLPHGIGAVAGCYVVMHIVLWQPLLCWWVGRKGPVNFRQVYGLLALPAWCGVWVALGLLGVRLLSSGWAPWFTVLVGCALATLLTLLATLALPKGRAMLHEVLTLLPAQALPRWLQPWLNRLNKV